VGAVRAGGQHDGHHDGDREKPTADQPGTSGRKVTDFSVQSSNFTTFSDQSSQVPSANGRRRRAHFPCHGYDFGGVNDDAGTRESRVPNS
jgi:hypothetical protein